jgi:hypothetical protein
MQGTGDVTTTTGGFAGLSGDTLLWVLLLAAAVIIGLMLLSGIGRGDRFHGEKGGRVRKRVTEYEDVDEEDELELERDRDRI